MNCMKCNAHIPDGSKFCMSCGTKVEGVFENNKIFCRSCGTPADAGDVYCGSCGAKLGNAGRSDIKLGTKNKLSYIVSSISAAICLIFRLALQEPYTSFVNILENREILGIEGDIKIFLTFIPVIAAVISSLLIVSDKTNTMQKKTTVFIINAVFIAAGLLFVWFGIPYRLFDF